MYEEKLVKEQVTKKFPNCQIRDVFSSSQPSMIEFFYKNSNRFLALNYFRKKDST